MKFGASILSFAPFELRARMSLSQNAYHPAASALASHAVLDAESP